MVDWELKARAPRQELLSCSFPPLGWTFDCPAHIPTASPRYLLPGMVQQEEEKPLEVGEQSSTQMAATRSYVRWPQPGLGLKSQDDDTAAICS